MGRVTDDTRREVSEIVADDALCGSVLAELGGLSSGVFDMDA